MRDGQEDRKRQRKPGGEFQLQPSDGLALLARLLVGGVLIVAAVAKMRAGRAQFFRSVYAYDLLPRRATWALAHALPSIELAVGVLLVLGVFAPASAAASGALLLTFTGAVAISLLRGRDQPCGCGGDLRPVSWRLVVRNLVLAAISVALATAGAGSLSLDRAVSVTPSVAPVAVAIAAIVCLSSAWVGVVRRSRISLRGSADRTNFREAAHV